MNDVEVILQLLEHRSFDQSACAHTPEIEVDWPEERALCIARYQALTALDAEIRAALRPAVTDQDVVGTAQARTMWFLLTEMGGSMRATIFHTQVEAEHAQERFRSTYKLEFDHEGYAACDISPATIPPRSSPLTGHLDARLACLVQSGGGISISIYETDEELVEAMEEANESHRGEAWISYDTILIPRIG